MEIEQIKSFTFGLGETQSYTKNVAMPTTMSNINWAHRQLSSGASTKFLSQIEVEIKWFESITMYLEKYQKWLSWQ